MRQYTNNIQPRGAHTWHLVAQLAQNRSSHNCNIISSNNACLKRAKQWQQSRVHQATGATQRVTCVMGLVVDMWLIIINNIIDNVEHRDKKVNCTGNLHMMWQICVETRAKHG